MIPHWSEDPFAGRTTVHGLASDEVRSALHKHIRRGELEQSVRAAIELGRTDADHEEMMWQRLLVIATEDIGIGTPDAIVVVHALRESARSFALGSWERLAMAAQAAGTLALAVKDPTVGEVMQVVVHEDRVPDIPDHALCVHTRRGQEMGRGLHDWYTTGTAMEPEADGRDLSWKAHLDEVYRRLDGESGPA